MKKFDKVAVGGTFDELHRGHKTLINKAFEIGEKVVIGLSTDEFVSRMGKAHKTASYGERLKDLNIFLKKSRLSEKSEIVPLNDPFGLTTSSKDLDALIVSKETESIANKINKIRVEAGLVPLKIVTVYMVLADNSNPISTTRIRKGEIDRNGHLIRNVQNQ
jgi:pantetheine-phosphate adenylyltransferase